ncbi:response regulator [Rhodococcus sp. NPDC059968]|uniref:response regulator n=1 Tax=Rhodococcus sp. NPDC059968 TaxID=3347017 RepID=UPI00366EDF6E
MSEPRRIGVFSIDDHEIVHAGLERLAQREPDFVFLGAAASVASAEKDALRGSPDIVMLNLFIGAEQGWSLCRDLLAASPTTKVVFYTGYGNAQLVDRVMLLGRIGIHSHSGEHGHASGHAENSRPLRPVHRSPYS